MVYEGRAYKADIESGLSYARWLMSMSSENISLNPPTLL